MPCAVQKFIPIKTDAIDERDLARFEFKLCFGRISSITQPFRSAGGKLFLLSATTCGVKWQVSDHVLTFGTVCWKKRGTEGTRLTFTVLIICRIDIKEVQFNNDICRNTIYIYIFIYSMCVNVFVFGCVCVWLDGCEWSRVWVRTCGCVSHCNTWCSLMISSNSNPCLKSMRFIQSLLETTYRGKICFCV